MALKVSKVIKEAILSRDFVILCFIFGGVYVLYPVYETAGYGLLVVQEMFLVLIFVVGAIVRSKLRVIISRLPPFTEELLSFFYMYLSLIMMFLVVPYFHNPEAIKHKALYWGVMGSLLFAMIYFIRVYPSFRPKTAESFKGLIDFTLEMFKLATTLWILFFIMTGIYAIFGDNVAMDRRDVLLFFIGMLAYTFCALGFLAGTYFSLLRQKEKGI